MRFFLLSIMATTTLFFISCEKDFVDDEECKPKTSGNIINGWEEGDSTDVRHPKDSILPNFTITVNEWGDTIKNNITL